MKNRFKMAQTIKIKQSNSKGIEHNNPEYNSGKIKTKKTSTLKELNILRSSIIFRIFFR